MKTKTDYKTSLQANYIRIAKRKTTGFRWSCCTFHSAPLTFFWTALLNTLIAFFPLIALRFSKFSIPCNSQFLFQLCMADNKILVCEHHMWVWQKKLKATPLFDVLATLGQSNILALWLICIFNKDQNTFLPDRLQGILGTVICKCSTICHRDFQKLRNRVQYRNKGK